MMAAFESMTARAETRLKFLEKQQIDYRTYKSDLEYCLRSSKQVLKEIIGAKLIIKVNLDKSAETQLTTYVEIHRFQSALQKNQLLLQQMKRLERKRNLQTGHVLISTQINEEQTRKQIEIISELKQKQGQVDYALQKKEVRMLNLRKASVDLQKKLKLFKQDNVLVLPLLTNYLEVHKHNEFLKSKLGKVSKRLQTVQIQRDQLTELFQHLKKQIEKYRMLVKNPIVRKKPAISNQNNLDMTMLVHQDKQSPSSSSEQIIFPNKFQINSQIKPSLPKLNFSKLSNSINLDISPVAKQRLHKPTSRLEILQKKCSQQTEVIIKLRYQLEEKKEKIKNKIEELEEVPIKTQRGASKKRKKKYAMSNALDYVYNPEIIVEGIPQLEYEHDVSSFIIPQNTIQFEDEPDSVLFYCINEIDPQYIRFNFK